MEILDQPNIWIMHIQILGQWVFYPYAFESLQQCIVLAEQASELYNTAAECGASIED